MWDPVSQRYFVHYRDAPAWVNTLRWIPFSRALWIKVDDDLDWTQPARDPSPAPGDSSATAQLKDGTLGSPAS